MRIHRWGWLAVMAMLVGPAAAEQPNIVLILADDMGWDSVSALNPHMGLQTPHIDRMAAAGVTFTDAHSTSAVCSPTRYSVLTGRYSWRSRLKKGIVGQWERPLIESHRWTLPELLRAQGYATACIGKWHLGWNWPRAGGGTTERRAEIDFARPIGGGPIDHGFDWYFGDDVPNWPPYAWRENDRLLGTITTELKETPFVGVSPGPSVAEWDFRAVLHTYGLRSAEYVRQRAAAGQPFFLYFALPSPHTPIAPHPTFQGRSGVSEYADFLIQTDWAVGMVLDALEESGQAENTLVLFTCDNGTSPKANFAELDAAGVHLNRHWRGWKADAYEGGHRVPLIARWPQHIPPATRCQHPVTLADLMATCAEVVGAELPVDAAEDSVSLWPWMQTPDRQDPVHDFVIHHSISGCFAVRSGNWKALFCAGSGGWSPPREAEAKRLGMPEVQLYDLSADPREQHNLQAAHPEIVDALRTKLKIAVESGRTTPGPAVPNHDGAGWWPGLPWEPAPADPHR
ncbi:MAG: arylsulfatase [Planctomycetota bacterium]|nr:MAG: arylsulfatase [Planctomycetota bacterium]